MNEKQKHTTQHFNKGNNGYFRAYVTAVVTVTLLFAGNVIAYATGGAVPPGSDPIAVVSNLSDFIFGLIRAIRIKNEE